MRTAARSLLLLAWLAFGGGLVAGPEPRGPFAGGEGFTPVNGVDLWVLAELRRRGIEPSGPCSEEAFFRRVHLDVIGTLPDPQEARLYLADTRPDRRARLIDRLLAREEFVDLWTLKWCDLLRVKSEFPINLWPNAVQAYQRWIHDAVRENRPYDRFARELLTSSGSSLRVPAVNFFRAVQGRTPEALGAAVALTFLGTRTASWSAEVREGWTACFARLAFKKTGEWKEEIVMPDPAPAGPLTPRMPDGAVLTVPALADPREACADWLLAPGNPWFARSIANRVWSWFFGRGIVHEPDDLRPDNPPMNPGLLAFLEREVVSSGYDLRALFRLILTSRTYQASPILADARPEARALFASYPVRPLDAEVLMDALCRLDGSGEPYTSTVPEPWTYLPASRRSITLGDGTITSPFLALFGRPPRDTGLESERTREATEAQRLWLLNSSEVRERIERSRWIRRLVTAEGRDPAGLVRSLYLALLSRAPTSAESDLAVSYLGADGGDVRKGAHDLAWALLNTKEFLFRH